MLAKNEVLQNRYKIVRQLGQGGMGAVYEAVDKKRFGNAIALKEILIDADENNPSRQRFLKRAFESEAKILAGLDHEAFPQVIDYFIETKRQFLVMELVQGENLSKLLENRTNPFSTTEVLDWAEQLLDALDYLHTLERAIFHRDIKPQNLKLTARGKIKMLDFGIAKTADSNCNLTLTNQTFIAATLHYSPLEQIIKAVDANYRDFLLQKFGKKFEKILASKTDARSDIYALGATLYHLLTNTLPVDSLKRALKIFAGEADPLPVPQALNAKISAAISEWILKALELESENRFSSALEMQIALNEVLEAEKFKLERELLREEYLRIENERRDFSAFNENVFEKIDTTCDTADFLFIETEAEDFVDKTFANLSTDSNLSVCPTAVSYLAELNIEPEIEQENLPITLKAKNVQSPKFSNLKFIGVASCAAIIFLIIGCIGFGIWFVGSEQEVNLNELEISAVIISEPFDFPQVEEEKIEIPVQPAVAPTPEIKPKETVKIKKTEVNFVPSPTQKKDKPKKQKPSQTVTVDDIINDN